MLKTNKYGKKIRATYNNIIKLQKAKYECPKCKTQKLRRISYSIWKCTKCNFTMAGGAYSPYTETGEFVIKMIEGE